MAVTNYIQAVLWSSFIQCVAWIKGIRFTPKLQEFASKYFTSGNMAIVGLGVSHEQLNVCAREMAIQSQSAPSTPKSHFIGG